MLGHCDRNYRATLINNPHNRTGKVGIFMKGFWRKNRFLLIAFSAVILFVVVDSPLSAAVFLPMSSGQFKVDPANKMDSRFWILTKETYGINLAIERPPELDRDTFDQLTGCPDLRKRPFVPVPGITIPFQWTVKSPDERIVAKSSSPSITPAGNACSSTGRAHLLSLGSFSIDPGRYRFEFAFSEEIPAFKNFSTEVFISCCGKSADTPLAGALLLMNFF